MSFFDKVLRYISGRIEELDITGTFKVLEDRKKKARQDLAFIRSLQNNPAIQQMRVAEVLILIRKGAQSPLLLIVCDDFAKDPGMIKKYTTVSLLEVLDQAISAYVSPKKNTRVPGECRE
jgi:hypothetical protein